MAQYSSRTSAALVALYLAAIVAANLAVTHFGPHALALTAFVLIPFDLVVRDVLHERWSHGRLWPKMAALILAGSALSWTINASAGPIALASLCAFGVAGVVDATVYAALRFPRFYRMNASNAASALTDSLIFPAVAFGVFELGLTMQQAGAKFIGGAVWSALFVLALKRAPAQPAPAQDPSETPTVKLFASADTEDYADESDSNP